MIFLLPGKVATYRVVFDVFVQVLARVFWMDHSHLQEENKCEVDDSIRKTLASALV